MKLSRFNIVIIIGFLAIVGVIIMQLFLINNAHKLAKKDTEDKIFFAFPSTKTAFDLHEKSTPTIKNAKYLYIIIFVSLTHQPSKSTCPFSSDHPILPMLPLIVC